MSIQPLSEDIPRVAGHWLLGSAREMREAPHLFAAEAAARHGGLARIRILHRRLIAVSHPDFLRQILVTRHESYERSFHYRTSRAIVGEGLLTTDGPYLRLRRRQIQPAFRPEAMERVLPAACSAVGEMFERWEGCRELGETVDVVSEMQVLTLTIMGRALLSAGMSPGEAAVLGGALRSGLGWVRRKNNAVCPMAAWVPTRANLALRAIRRALDRFVTAHLRPRTGPGQSGGEDMVRQLLEARDPETGEALPWQSLLDETKTLLAAGFETTATALAWTLHALSHHPEVARRWHAEVDSVLGGRAPVWADLPRLGYTEQILQESLRLFPPVYTMGRVCRVEDRLGGHRIRVGETLLLSVYGAHRTAEFWPEPERFDPDRFAPGREGPRHAWLPFALGKHQCIGNTFAMAEATLVLALIGQRYRLSPTVPFGIPSKAQVTLVPAVAVPVRLERRS